MRLTGDFFFLDIYSICCAGVVVIFFRPGVLCFVGRVVVWFVV